VKKKGKTDSALMETVSTCGMGRKATSSRQERTAERSSHHSRMKHKKGLRKEGLGLQSHIPHAQHDTERMGKTPSGPTHTLAHIRGKDIGSNDHALCSSGVAVTPLGGGGRQLKGPDQENLLCINEKEKKKRAALSTLPGARLINGVAEGGTQDMVRLFE